MASTSAHDHAHDHAHGDGHGHGHAEGAGAHHVDPLWLYMAIFAALIVMTVVTVGASYVDFGAANTIIAVVIASIKASLVAIFFMHLRHDKPFHSLVLLSGLFFLSFLFLFTLSDQGTRNDVDDMHGRPVEEATTATASPTVQKAPEPPGSPNAPKNVAPGNAPAHH
jgi:cytochrome c oxidase subunit IV